MKIFYSSYCIYQIYLYICHIKFKTIKNGNKFSNSNRANLRKLPQLE